MDMTAYFLGRAASNASGGSLNIIEDPFEEREYLPNDIYNALGVQQIVEYIGNLLSEIDEETRAIHTEDFDNLNSQFSIINDSFVKMPKPLKEGFLRYNYNRQYSGLSAGTGEALGMLSWVEGSSGYKFVDLNYASNIRLDIQTSSDGKSTTTEIAILYTFISGGAETIEEHKEKIEKHKYLRITFTDEPETYYYLVRGEVQSLDEYNMKILFSFAPGSETFPIDLSESGREISQIAMINAVGDYSHSEGEGTIAKGKAQHTQGKYNIIDEEGLYAHIVGNGNSDTERSNAHTVDWDGNAWYAGSVTSKKIFTDDIVAGLWSGANITQLFTHTTTSTISLLDGNLIPEQYYLFVLGDVEYRTICKKDLDNNIALHSLDDDNVQSWKVCQADENIIRVDTSSAGIVISLSKVDLRIVNLFDYIEKLEARIKTLEDAQAVTE